MENKKKAIIITGYGTTYKESIKLVYSEIKDYLSIHFPDYYVNISFTSSYIIKTLLQTDIHIFSITEMLSFLKSKDYEEVILLSTHLIEGTEYNHLKELLLPFQGSFSLLKLSPPILSDNKNVEIILSNIASLYSPIPKDTAVLFMSHGSIAPYNEIYMELFNELQNAIGNLFLATIKSYPNLYDIIKILKLHTIQKVILVPFMMVSGAHVKKDMIGKQDESWKNILVNHGFIVTSNLKGLGEYTFIKELFVDIIKCIKHSK